MPQRSVKRCYPYFLQNGTPLVLQHFLSAERAHLGEPSAVNREMIFFFSSFHPLLAAYIILLLHYRNARADDLYQALSAILGF